MAHCTVCEKTTRFGNNMSRSLQRTRRKMKPNIQKVGGLVLCTRCLRNVRKQVALTLEKQALAAEVRSGAQAEVQPVPAK